MEQPRRRTMMMMNKSNFTIAGWLDCLTPNDDRRQTLWENSLIGSIDCFKGNSFRSVLKTPKLCLILHILFILLRLHTIFLGCFRLKHTHTHSQTLPYFISPLSLCLPKELSWLKVVITSLFFSVRCFFFLRRFCFV